jgi:hypothetical protein
VQAHDQAFASKRLMPAISATGLVLAAAVLGAAVPLKSPPQ